MKKRIMTIALFFIIAFVTTFSAFAEDSPFYPKSLYILKIYPHRLGYRIDYQRDDYSIGTFYAPIKWFTKAGGVGQLVYGKGNEYPYVTFFFKEGEIHHFRLFLVKDLSHPSWGRLSMDKDYSEKFQVEGPEVIFYKGGEVSGKGKVSGGGGGEG